MRTRLQRGEGSLDGIIILAVILIIIWVTPKGNTNSDESGNWVPRTTISSYSTTTSPQAQYISLGTGNAAYSYQPYEEYISIENRGNTAIDITGWQLKNGKDKRPYYLGGTLQRFSADVAIIPQATLSLSPTGASVLSNVVLGQNERAIVTTGAVGPRSSIQITSFKENMCTGYIEALPDYAFIPPLSQNCPRPASEPGIRNLPPDCRDFINTLSSCKTPEFGGRNREGQSCDNCVNGVELPNYCRAFIKEHFSYQGCVANHGKKPDFSGRTWRIFLGRGWEMWAKDYETIELFNQSGQLVDFQNY